MRTKILLTLGFFLLVWFPAQAQDATPDAPGTFQISYDETVQQSITPGGFYDTWRLSAQTGDVIVAYMRASNGLAPFLAILDPSSDVVAQSTAGEVNGEVTVEWTVVTAGIYTVYASRVDDQYGTTTGDYELEVRNANPQPNAVDPYENATFQCQDFEAATAITVDFGDDPDQTSAYRISVYGFDGLQPVINIYIPDLNVSDCSSDGRFMGGDVLTLPNDMTLTVPEGDSPIAGRLNISGADRMGIISLTIGAAYRLPGRYVVVIEGLHIGAQDGDSISIGSGPLAAGSPVLLYMVRAQNSRLDPFVQAVLNDGTLLTCDDAGRRTCAGDVPTFRDSSIVFSEGNPLVGSRFDAGLLLAPALGELLTVGMTSFEYRTSGEYALVIIGQLPAATP
ncbi:MAG: hypothetical protein U0694_02870 [Anaerolineae bacterium]